MKSLTHYVTLLFVPLLLLSCSDSTSVAPGNNGNENKDPSVQFVIAAKPTASQENSADYLLTVDNLSNGSVSLLNHGIEQDGSARNYVVNGNKFYSLLYGFGAPGAVTVYQLNSAGELVKIKDFQSESFNTLAPVKDDVLMMKIPKKDANDPTAHWYRLNTDNSQFVANGQINVIELANKGESAYFSWITQVGDQVFASYFTIDRQGDNIYSTSYPNSAWIAVFSYPEMELQTVIKDDRTSFVGRYFTKGLSVDEKGDIYAFSSATAMNEVGDMISSKPSAITRIKSGTYKFDQDYFFNIKKASGGYYLTNHVYASDGNVLLFMRDIDKKDPWAAGHRLAIVNVYTKSFTWVEGLPDPSAITNVTARYGANNYVSEDGNTIYTGITIAADTTADGTVIKEGGSYVYAIDVQTATAKQGLKVEGGVIKAIKRLEPAQ